MVCERLASSSEDQECGTTPIANLDGKSGLSALDGPQGESMPSRAFRLGLALRRCGDEVEAEACFSWSRRLMVDRYMADRIVGRHRHVRLDAMAADSSAAHSGGASPAVCGAA
jgi:hypothetical protein